MPCNAILQGRKRCERLFKNGCLLAVVVISGLCVVCALFRVHILSWIVSDSTVIYAGTSCLFLIFPIVFARIPYQILMTYLQGIGKEQYVFVCTVSPHS